MVVSPTGGVFTAHTPDPERKKPAAQMGQWEQTQAPGKACAPAGGGGKGWPGKAEHSRQPPLIQPNHAEKLVPSQPG